MKLPRLLNDNKRPTRFTLLGAVALAIVGIGMPLATNVPADESGMSSSRATAAVDPDNDSAVVGTPTPAPPQEAEFLISCSAPDYSQIRYVDFRAAWGQSYEHCEAEATNDAPLSDEEERAFALSKYTDRSSFKTLVGMCAETKGFYATNGVVSDQQVDEAQAVLALCPDNPSAPAIRAGIDRLRGEQSQTASGTRFGPGSHLVNSEIAPGTFTATSPSTSCYWERLDAAGNIIDNNFVTSGTHVQATILESDCAFNSRGCGDWAQG